MFDQHHYHRHDTTSRTIITENRAPTDESVRILRDMEDRAEKKVLAAVRVENTPVDMVIHKHHDMRTSDRLYVCIFNVNGHQMRTDYRERLGATRKDVAIGIRDAVASEIANLICAQAMRAAFSKFDLNN